MHEAPLINKTGKQVQQHIILGSMCSQNEVFRPFYKASKTFKKLDFHSNSNTFLKA